MQHPAVRTFHDLSLVTLPWVGLGVIHWSIGIDTGAGLQPSWLFLALAMFAAAVVSVRRSGLRATFVTGPSNWPRAWWIGGGLAAGAVLISGLGLVTAPVPESAGLVWSRYLRQMIQLLIMGCFVFAPALWTRGERRWRRTILLLGIAAAGQAVYGALQGISFYLPNPAYAELERIFTSNPSILSGSEQLYLGDAFREIPRLRGTVCEPLYLGNFLVMALPWIGLGPLSPRRRIVLSALVAVLLLGTWSRGAWLGLMTQGALLVVLRFVARNRGGGDFAAGRRPLALVGVVVAAMVAAALALGLVFGFGALLLPFERLLQSFSTQDWSNLTRLYSMQAAWRTFLTSPWVGVGWGQYAWHFPIHADPMGLQSQFNWPMVNNFPLQILCETGVIGFAAFGGTTVALARAALRAFRRAGPQRPLVRAALLSVAGVWIQLLTFSQYNLPHIWVAVGLLLAAIRESEREVSP